MSLSLWPLSFSPKSQPTPLTLLIQVLTGAFLLPGVLLNSLNYVRFLSVLAFSERSAAGSRPYQRSSPPTWLCPQFLLAPYSTSRPWVSNSPEPSPAPPLVRFLPLLGKEGFQE